MANTMKIEPMVGNPWGTRAERDAYRAWRDEKAVKLAAETNAAMAAYRAARAKRLWRAAKASGIHG